MLNVDTTIRGIVQQCTNGRVTIKASGTLLHRSTEQKFSSGDEVVIREGEIKRVINE